MTCSRASLRKSASTVGTASAAAPLQRSPNELVQGKQGRSMVSDRGATAVSPSAAGGRVRWIVVALLFAATAINYVDRQMLGLLKPTLEQQFGWSEETYANDIVVTFQLAYA